MCDITLNQDFNAKRIKEIMTCFKKIDKSADVFYRRKNLGDGKWIVATEKDVNGSGAIFVDSKGQPHPLSLIANAGFLNDTIFPLYLYSGVDADGNQLYRFVEVDEDNAKIIKNYIISNICPE